MEDSALISRESVEKEGEEAGLPAKLTKPTFCKVSPHPPPPSYSLPRARPSSPLLLCVTRAAYPEGGEQPRSLSRAVLNCITCRGGGYKIPEPGRWAGDLRTSPLQGPLCSQPRRRHLRIPKGLTGCTGSAPRAELRTGEGRGRHSLPGPPATHPSRHVALLLCRLAHHQGLLATRALAARTAPRARFLHPAGHAVPVGDVHVRARLRVPQERRVLRVPALRHFAPALLSGAGGLRRRGRRDREYRSRRRRGGGGLRGLAPAQESVLFGSWGRAVLPAREPLAPSPPPAAAPPSPPPTPTARLGGGSGGRGSSGSGRSGLGAHAAPRTCLRRHHLQRGGPAEIPLSHHG